MKTNQNPRLRGVFFNILKKALLAFALIIMFFSCDDADQVGLDLIDSPAYMFATDTITIRAVTVADDSVATSLGWLNVLGFLDDPVFGKSRASIFTETRLPLENLTLGDNPVLDSIHLVLAYEGRFYGVPQTYHTVKVYELTENFPEEDTLYSNSIIPYSLDLITQHPDGFRTTFLPRDSVFVDGVKRQPQLRIPLSEAFGQRFIDAIDTEAFENIPNYLDHFKGLYITVDDKLEGIGSGIDPDPKGGMVLFNMPAELSSLELFYHSGDDTLSVAIPVNRPMQRFPIDQIAKHFTHVEHFGYENTDRALKEQILEGNESYGDSLLFLQAFGLVRTDITLPFINELEGKEWLINKAQLIIPVQEGYESSFFREPQQLILLKHTEENGLEFLDDYMLGVDYFGGVYDANNNQYVFNISRYFQKLIDGDYQNDGLALLTARRQEMPGRVVLHGPGRTENPLRLEVFYTVFE